jgi:hypothetical protein
MRACADKCQFFLRTKSGILPVAKADLLKVYKRYFTLGGKIWEGPMRQQAE